MLRIQFPDPIKFLILLYFKQNGLKMKISKTATFYLINLSKARSSYTFKKKTHHTSNPALENLILFQRDEQILKTNEFLRKEKDHNSFSYKCFVGYLVICHRTGLSDIREGSSKSTNDAIRRPLRNQKVPCRAHKSL